MDPSLVHVHSVADGFALVEQVNVTGSLTKVSNLVSLVVMTGASRIKSNVSN